VWLARGREDDSIIEGYEESARKIWAAHVADVREHGAPVLRVDEEGMRLAWDRALARRRRRPPEDSYDKASAARGQAVFNGKARCGSCHVPPLYTEPGYSMHKPEEIGIDAFQANRSPDKMYRTTPLRGLFVRAKGGFYHDGRFPDLNAVVRHYERTLKVELTSEEREDLVSFLKSL
jgi:hypothetical protein